jgi:hypothetical protein
VVLGSRDVVLGSRDVVLSGLPTVSQDSEFDWESGRLMLAALPVGSAATASGSARDAGPTSSTSTSSASTQAASLSASAIQVGSAVHAITLAARALPARVCVALWLTRRCESVSAASSGQSTLKFY